MRRAFLALLITWLSFPVLALTPGQRAVILSGVPGWVLRAGGKAASVDLNFAAGQYYGGSLSSLLSVSRASQETVTWKDGHLTYAGNNVAAISDFGLQVWEARTNLLLQSQTFQTTWTTTNVFDATFATTTTAADLTTTAQKLTENTTNGQHLVSQSVTKAASALAYSDCVYASSAQRSRIFMLLDDGAGNGATVTIDISGVQVGVAAAGIGVAFTSISASVTASYSGIVRGCLFATSNTATTIRVQYALDNATGTAAASNSYAGTNGNGAFIWGAQLEQAASASPYIPTTTGSATRAADLVRPIGAASSALQTAAVSSFVLGLGGSINFAVSQPTLLGLGTSPEIDIPFITNSTHVNNWMNANAASAAFGSGGSTGTSKIAASADANGNSAVANNGTVATSALALPARTPAVFSLGSLNGGGNTFYNGTLARFAVWSLRLPDASLKALTQ